MASGGVHLVRGVRDTLLGILEDADVILRLSQRGYVRLAPPVAADSELWTVSPASHEIACGSTCLAVAVERRSSPRSVGTAVSGSGRLKAVVVVVVRWLCVQAVTTASVVAV